MRFPFLLFILLTVSVLRAEDLPVLGSLDETIQSLRTTSPPLAAYLNACDALAWNELPFGQPVVLPQIPLQVLVDDVRSDVLQGSLRYYLALKLVQAKLYDEAETVLNEIAPEKTLDPCGLLIHKALVFHHLHHIEKGSEVLAAFYEAIENSNTKNTVTPRRYIELAKLLDFELQKEKKEEENNPEKIAKKMSNIRQRLGQGQTGDETQNTEKDVMKSLDQLIEKVEKQYKQQAQEGGEGQQANNPADDSRILKQKGPGNIDRREFDPNGNWGDLPPKEREEALIKLEKEFPAHYREIIEQYFREMAGKE